MGAVTRVLIGYFIRRTYRNLDEWRGKTISAHEHRLYPTRELAAWQLGYQLELGQLDERFVYDVAEAWMLLEGES